MNYLERELYGPDGVRGLAGGAALRAPGPSAASHLFTGSEISQGRGAGSGILASVTFTRPLQISYPPEAGLAASSSPRAQLEARGHHSGQFRKKR